MSDYQYNKRWKLDRSRGITRLVDSGPTVDHIRRLLASGFTKRGIAEAAQVSPSTIVNALTGEGRMQRRVADRILAVRPRTILGRTNPDGFVPAIGSRRRIEALLALGWRHQDITAHMQASAGVRQHSAIVLHQQGNLLARSTADAVTAAYEALSGATGPSATTRTRARRQGYMPPLAWDDSLDNPDAHPVGARADLGRRTYGTDLDEWAWLVRSGESPTRAAERCGVLLSSVEVAARRNGRDDIFRLLDIVRKEAAA